MYTLTIQCKLLFSLIKSTPSVSSPEVESPFLSNHSEPEVVGQNGAERGGVGKRFNVKPILKDSLTLNHFSGEIV